MPKAKEIKVEWVHGTYGTIGGQIYFVNAEDNDCFCTTIYSSPEEKVLKAKVWIKEWLADRVVEFISCHQGWKQVDKITYDLVYANRVRKF